MIRPTKMITAHKPSPVKTCTLSICQVLKYAGTNPTMFKSHSVRAASTSKDKTLGISLVKFSKRVRGSKNQHGKTSIKRDIFRYN